jgi:hypothetical protein
LTVARSLLALAALGLFTAWGCSDDSEPAATGPVLGSIPWEVPETSRYRLLDGDDEIGSAVIAVEVGDSSTGLDVSSFTQRFEFPEREITDEVVVTAEAETLAPQTGSRTIDGPEGERRWEVAYESGQVAVFQSDEDDERTDTLAVPLSSYDTWTDLFLWRTLDFREGYEVKYLGVVTADLAKPDVITITLKVTGVETVEVPAGSYEAWRLEIRAGGRTQKAWISDAPDRKLIRYDNTELVFELVE